MALHDSVRDGLTGHTRKTRTDQEADTGVKVETTDIDQAMWRKMIKKAAVYWN